MASGSREHPFGHGRLAYVQIPALAGVILYVYVHGIDATVEKMVAAGSRLVKPPYPEGDLWVATLTDPAGNIVGIWQFDPR